ncbi:ANF_receptor domain-containing protein [Nephila pilipes]|uniref:ANF_receptor domain-containing protein n=1 Tax=Nephila pilipes TaxID=299642 RepID=A0A8X6Q150_NEPPI|nr:ANF_receptor domain-containing protein [Nephila pilipes]
MKFYSPGLFLAFTLISFIYDSCHSETFTIGYLTGSERRHGNTDYHRPGLSISGAITLAVDEINRLHPLMNGHVLNFTVAETYGDEEESILRVALLWTQEVAGYIGPQETCVHEAKMASGFNLPMISYVSRLNSVPEIVTLTIKTVFLKILKFACSTGYVNFRKLK